MCSGVRRLKQHLAGGYADVSMCPRTTTAIQKEMKEYIDKHAKKTMIINDDVEIDDDEICDIPSHNASIAASNTIYNIYY